MNENLILNRGETKGDVSDFTVVGYCESPCASQLLNLYHVSPTAKTLTDGFAAKVFGDGFVFKDSKDEEIKVKGLAEIRKYIISAYGRARAVNNGIFYWYVEGESIKDLSTQVSYNGNKSIKFGYPTGNWSISSGGTRLDYTKTTNGRTETFKVHHSRVIQIKPSLDDEPWLKPIFNNIIRYETTAAAAGLGFIQNARTDMIVTAKATDGVDAQAVADGVKGVIEKIRGMFSNNVKRFVAGGMNIDAKAITYPTESPVDTLKGVVQQISFYAGYPLRVVTGEGSGVLAGSEDYAALNAVIGDARQSDGVLIVNDFKESLIAAGFTKLIDSRIEFNQQAALSEEQQADNDNKQADTESKRAQTVMTLAESLELTKEQIQHYIKAGELDG